VDGGYDASTPGWGYTNFATIQSAVDGVGSSGLIHVNPGTYDEVGQIVIAKDVTITGAGRDTTIIRPTQNTGTSGDARGWILVDSGIEFNLEGVTLDGTGFLVYQGIRQKGHGSIKDVAFVEIKYNESGPNYSGVAMAAFGDGPVDVSGSTFDEIGRVGVLYFGAALSGSSFTGNEYIGKGAGDWLDYCLDISAGANVVVSNNVITGCHGVASSDGSTSAGILVTTYYGAGTGADITGNVISGNYQGIAVGYDTSDTSTVTAEHNDLSYNDIAITAQDGSSVAAPLNYYGDDVENFRYVTEGPVEFIPVWVDPGMTELGYLDLYVDDDFTAAETGWGVTNFATVQDAVAASIPGGYIEVAAGNYVSGGSVLITHTLAVVGTGSAEVTLDVSSSGAAPGLDIMANDVMIEGMSIVPGPFNGDGSAVRASAIGGIRITGLVLRDLEVNGGFRTPFDLHGVDGALLARVEHAEPALLGHYSRF
jgi:hypothetical protein